MIAKITILTTTILTVTCERHYEAISGTMKELTMPNLETTTSTTTATTPTVNQIYKQNPDIPCGLPPFTDQLPTKERNELRKTWLDYKVGSECGLQQAKTFDIVNKLSNEDRIRIFGVPANVPPAAVADFSIGVVPMFIRTSPPQTKQLFDAILTNDTMNENEKFASMEKLAAKLLSKTQLADFKLWINTLKLQKAKIDARIDALSTEASEVLKQITELRLKEKKILESLTPKIALELTGLI